MTHSRDKHIHYAIAAMVAGALALRLLNLGGKSLWLDEAYNLAVVSSSIRDGWPLQLWPAAFENHHPPLSYVLLRQWLAWGYSEFWIRLLPALFGTACVPLVFLFARRLANRSTAITAAGLAAVSPLMVWYSQEARSYSFLAFLGLIAMIAAVRLFQAPRVMNAIAFGAAMTAALYTHYAAVLLVPLQFLLLAALMAQRKSRVASLVHWLAGLAIAGVAFCPWLITPAAQEFLATARTGSYPGQMVATMFGTTPGTVVTVVSLIAIATLIVAAGGVFTLAPRRLMTRTVENGRRLDVMLMTVVVLLVCVACVVPRGYSFKKQLLVLWPYGLVLIGWWWPWTPEHRKKVLAAWALSLVCALGNVFAVPKDDWRGAAAYLAAESKPGDTVVLLPTYSVFPFEYYNRGTLPVVAYDAASTGGPSAAASNRPRVWLVSNREQYADPNGTARTALARHATWVRSQSFYRIQVDLFEARD